MGVKRQNGCHSGRLTPERWGTKILLFNQIFFQTFLFLPILFYINTSQPFIIHFQILKNQNHSSNLSNQSQILFKNSPFSQILSISSQISFQFFQNLFSPPYKNTFGLLIPPHHSNLLFSSLSSFLSFA